MESPSPSGRPEPGEFAADHLSEVLRLAGGDVVDVLSETRDDVLATLGGLADDAVSGVSYAAGKWTIKDVLQHLIDDERSYASRAMSIARGDPRPQAGFDETLYALHARGERRDLADLLDEFQLVRASTLAMFVSMPSDAWLRRGVSNGVPVTVRGLGFQMAAHELHHLDVLRERYLPLIGSADG